MAATQDIELLLQYKTQYFKLCDEFSIPLEQRGEEWVGDGIIERIHTYLTSYIMRRSFVEKGNKQAFISPDTKDEKPQG